MTDSETYKTAVKKWGTDSQIRQAIEECTELTLALLHHARLKTSGNDVCGEIADVEIMCAQLRLIFGSERVEMCKQYKLALTGKDCRANHFNQPDKTGYRVKNGYKY